jgi:dTDP-4-dehydrorhamnose 3,5-epimerase
VHAADVTAEWLQSIQFEKPPGANRITIEGVVVRDLTVHLDGRGEVTELWSKPWLQEGMVEFEHVYQSATDAGVVKSWHYHQVHTDQFVVTRGKLQVALADIRPDSPSFGQVNTVFLGTQRPRLIKIPPMVMHGWKALSEPEVIVVNLQSHVFTLEDEFRVPWDTVLTDVWEPKNG